MKLLIVAPYFHPKIGGMEKYVYTMCMRLKSEHDCDIVVVTSNHERRSYEVDAVDAIKVYRLPPLFMLSNTPINPLWYVWIKRIIAAEKPDLINAHAPVPFIADMAAFAAGRIPFVLTYHAGSMKRGKAAIDLIVGVYERYVQPRVFGRARIIAAYATQFVSLPLLARATDLHHVTPGVDTRLFHPGAAGAAGATVTFVGRIEKNADWKGINYLLDAMRLVKDVLPSVRVVLVGAGDQVDYYKAYAERLGLAESAVFTGSLRGERLVQRIQESSVVVLPSVANAESFGMVLIEAMACKKPVIGSRIGGIPFVIDDGVDGLLVPPRDAPALARAIIAVLGDPTLAARLGTNGYLKAIDGYAWEGKATQTHDILAHYATTH